MTNAALNGIRMTFALR